MNKVEKIKAEIERRLRTIEPNLPSREEFDKVADRNPGINSDFNIGEKMGAFTMLKKVEQFIDSLEEEPISNDLEEAARKTGQKYFPNEDNIWARPNYEAKKVEYAFKEGAQWQKEKLSKAIKLADAMYYAAQMLSTDASHLSKAMKDWWNFKNVELNKK